MVTISLTSSMTSFAPSIREVVKAYDEEIDYKFIKVASRLEFSRLDTTCIKLMHLDTKQIITKAGFTEIQNCKAEEIHVIGDLYLHGCTQKINKVTATGDIFIEEMDSISEVISNGTVHVLKDLFTNSCLLKIDAIRAKNSSFWYTVESDVDYFTFENVTFKGPVNLNRRIKTLYINGNCGYIPQIIFNESSLDNSVVMTPGAAFFGDVINGNFQCRNLRY